MVTKAQRQQWLDEEKEQEKAAARFGVTHGGWKYVTRKAFWRKSPFALIAENGANFLDPFDHPYLYIRGQGEKAVASHLYGLDEKKRERLRALASAYGIEVEFPDQPSWWYVGTKLVWWRWNGQNKT